MDLELKDAVQAATADRAVVGIVITGAERGFCAGRDMDDLASLNSESPQAFPSVAMETAQSIDGDFDGRFTWLLAVKKPIIAAINGPVAGMAVPLALCCDIRFIAEDAPVVTAFSQRGLIAEWGIAWLLPRMIGTGNALDLLFSSRRLTGAEAAQMGLAQKALPAGDVLPHSIRYVRDLAARSSPTSMSIMKQQVYTQLSAPLGPSEREARALMLESFTRPDFQEGVSSFLERRPPTFTRLGSELTNE
jgi:enoyl-CoA hydratase/carnithine racemase